MDDNNYISVKITVRNSLFEIEKRYPRNVTVGELKAKLELITGVESDEMFVDVFCNGLRVCSLEGDNESLKSFIPVDALTNEDIQLVVYPRNGKSDDFTDLNRVEKFELSDDEYAKRNVSLRAFKMQHKLGRFGDKPDGKMIEEEDIGDVAVGKRCRVSVKGNPTRVGTVMYVGATKFKPGIWVGVKYDEPLGKNDGSVEGVRYFDCLPKYGGFVRLSDIEVGDFTEEGIDELDEL